MKTKIESTFFFLMVAGFFGLILSMVLKSEGIASASALSIIVSITANILTVKL